MDDDILRRHFVAVATREYDDPRWKDLPVDTEVADMRAWLCDPSLAERRFRPAYEELAENPTKHAIRTAFEDPPPEVRWRDSDAATVFVTGHGVVANGQHLLVLRATESDRPEATGFRSGDLIAWLTETRVRHLLLILDACYAGQVAAEVLRLDRQLPDSWIILPSATRDETAVAGALTTAINAFLKQLTSREGEQYGIQRYLTVENFLDGVQEHLGEGQSLKLLYGGQHHGQHVCLPNPHYRPPSGVDVAPARRDLAVDRQELEAHWGPRSRGVVTADQAGWLFTGRAELMATVIEAAVGAPGVTLVTGGAGSGKSAVLARLVTLSDHHFLEQHAADVALIPALVRPPPGAVDVAVLATGKLHTQVLAQICHALQVPMPANSTELTVEQRLPAWHAWLADQGRPVTVVIDALDEAADPHVLVREVLARLERDGDPPRLRLLIGVRSLGSGAESAAPPEATVLSRIAEDALRARRIAVDESPWWVQDDVIDYVESILAGTAGSPYGRDRQATRAVAVALGNRAGRSFLVANIAASSLAAQRRVIADDDPRWLAALDAGLLGVFRRDLHQSLPDPGDRRRAVTLLRAVAFARGTGMPWRHIWPRVANAVDEDGGYYGDSDIAWLLDSRLGAYLVTDQEDDLTVYRLFHDLLRSTLQLRWREILDPPPGDAAVSSG